MQAEKAKFIYKESPGERTYTSSFYYVLRRKQEKTLAIFVHFRKQEKTLAIFVHFGQDLWFSCYVYLKLRDGTFPKLFHYKFSKLTFG